MIFTIILAMTLGYFYKLHPATEARITELSKIYLATEEGIFVAVMMLLLPMLLAIMYSMAKSSESKPGFFFFINILLIQAGLIYFTPELRFHVTDVISNVGGLLIMEES